jgi:hypothetical protein
MYTKVIESSYNYFIKSSNFEFWWIGMWKRSLWTPYFPIRCTQDLVVFSLAMASLHYCVLYSLLILLCSAFTSTVFKRKSHHPLLSLTTRSCRLNYIHSPQSAQLSYIKYSRLSQASLVNSFLPSQLVFFLLLCLGTTIIGVSSRSFKGIGPNSAHRELPLCSNLS